MVRIQLARFALPRFGFSGSKSGVFCSPLVCRGKKDPSVKVLLYMLGYWLWDLADCMRHEEEKIVGNTRDRGEKQG